MSIKEKRRVLKILIVNIIIIISLIIRIGWIQFVQGTELQSMAYQQQTLNRAVNPKRGTIYDSSGKIELAVSSSVETISINPTNIEQKDKEKVAKALSDIFNLNYENVLKKVNKNSSIETITKKVEKDLTDKLRIWLKENSIEKGINIDEDTKRYYPYGSLGSQIIGFTGSDNQGLEGIEANYDDILSGEKGKILKLVDATGDDMGVEGEDYIKAVDGDNIILTIDMTIQAIVEKYLEQACIDNECTDGGNSIIIDVNTGDILAMATYPNYDLNNPYIINSEDLVNVWESLPVNEKSTYLQQMWRNKAISDTYEPGSTFKLVTTSAAIEENIVTDIDAVNFVCTGSINIAGTTMKCWRYYRPHGSQSLRQALMNSCNPVFIGLGQKIGVEKYYEYLRKFGFLKKTAIDLPGEASSIFLKEEKVGPVELATISFGQRFEVTPIQMVKMVATIANGGKEVTPRFVKKIISSKTGEEKKIDIKEGEQVISKKTSEKVLSMMKSVVAEGTGRNAKVEGYKIGGKTGTSEDGVNTNKYVTSFVGIAGKNEPEIAIIIILYNPTGEGGHQGGAVAAPIASQILEEVLPYLTKDEENSSKRTIEMPDVTGLKIEEAIKILREMNLEVDFNKEGFEVVNQLPKKGIKIFEGTKVILY